MAHNSHNSHEVIKSSAVFHFLPRRYKDSVGKIRVPTFSRTKAHNHKRTSLILECVFKFKSLPPPLSLHFDWDHVLFECGRSKNHHHFRHSLKERKLPVIGNIGQMRQNVSTNQRESERRRENPKHCSKASYHYIWKVCYSDAAVYTQTHSHSNTHVEYVLHWLDAKPYPYTGMHIHSIDFSASKRKKSIFLQFCFDTEK